MTYPPLQVTEQLDGSPQAGSNCGPSAASQAIGWAKGRANGPSPSEVRVRSGDAAGATALPDLERAIASYGVGCRRRKDAEWDRALELLADPKVMVLFGIDYGALPRSRKSAPRFDGGHYVTAARLADGLVRIWDPLADGRSPGIAEGVQRWPIRVLRDACKAYSVDGDWSGIIVRRPKPIITPEAPDEPEPEATCADELSEALTRVSVLESVLDAVDAGLDDLVEIVAGAKPNAGDPEPDDDREGEP